MVHPAAPTPPNDGVSLTEPRRTALTHLLVLAHNTPVHPHPHSHTNILNRAPVPPVSKANPDPVTASPLRCAVSQKQ